MLKLLATSAALLACAVGIFLLGLFLHRKGLEWADKFAGVGALFLALFALIQPVAGNMLRWLRGDDRELAISGAMATYGITLNALAQAVRQLWEPEEVRRRINDPDPLQVTWTTLGPPITDYHSVIRRDGQDEPLDLDGSFDDLYEIVTAKVPTGRVVVLGEPGSGKTALLLRFTLRYLAARATQKSEGRVAVILRLSTWNSLEETMQKWMSRRLIEDYGSGVGSKSLADELIANRLLLPVLDGLDEMPAAHRGRALLEINSMFGADAPLVMASRKSEYLAAIRDTDVLTGAAVLQLNPVNVEEICRYLVTATPPGRAYVWRTVLTRVRRYPTGRLATALSTPLMLSLARVAYAEQDASPSELLTLPNREAIETHLLDQLIPAVYPDPPRMAVDGRIWDRSNAQQWLTFLATHLCAGSTYDLAWWELSYAVPRPVRSLVNSLLGGLIGGLIGGLAGLLIAGSMGGLAGSLAGAIATGVVLGLDAMLSHPGTIPRRAMRPIKTGEPIVNRILRGVRIGLSDRFHVGIPGKVASLFMFSLTFVAVNRVDQELVSPLILGGIFGVASWIVFRFTLGIIHEFSTVFEWVDLKGAMDPAIILRHDRTRVRMLSPAIGLIGGFAGWLVGGSPLQSVIGFALGLSLGLVFGASSAWGEFFMVRICLFLTGRMPWQVIPFLEDAQRRGVLRQAGGVYQFRHGLLRDHLASCDRVHSWD